jgi:cytochrome b subunit of formate dehydrogenase
MDPAMSRYRFARFWAAVLVIIGLLLIAGGLLLAAAAVTLDMPWGSLTGQAVLERMLAAVLLVISGVLTGAPFIVLGEIMRLFVEQRRIAERQRRLLARIARRVDEAAGRRAAGTAAADRLLQQRRP